MTRRTRLVGRFVPLLVMTACLIGSAATTQIDGRTVILALTFFLAAAVWMNNLTDW